MKFDLLYLGTKLQRSMQTTKQKYRILPFIGQYWQHISTRTRRDKCIMRVRACV